MNNCESCPAIRDFEKRMTSIEMEIKDLHRNDEVIGKLQVSFAELSEKLNQMANVLNEIKSALQGVLGRPGIVDEMGDLKEHVDHYVSISEKNFKTLEALQTDIKSLQEDKKWTIRVILEKVIGWVVTAAAVCAVMLAGKKL